MRCCWSLLASRSVELLRVDILMEYMYYMPN